MSFFFKRKGFIGMLFLNMRKTHAAPVPKGIPVKIPEPEGWTECYSYNSVNFFLILRCLTMFLKLEGF